MVVHTVLLDFTVSSNIIVDVDKRSNLKSTIANILNEHFNGLKLFTDTNIDVGFITLYTGQSGSLITVRGYPEGLITVNVEYYEGDKEKAVITFESARKLGNAMQKAVTATRSHTLPPIKRGCSSTKFFSPSMKLYKQSINSLDDDCLMKIFSYFSIADIMQAERVCRRWYSLLQRSWKTVSELTCSLDGWLFRKDHGEDHEVKTISELADVLRHCGQFITDLTIYGRDLDTIIFTVLMRTIVKYCNHIKNADITMSQSPSQFKIYELLNGNSNLEELLICGMRHDMEDDFILLRSKNTKLRSFAVKFSHISGKFFEYLPTDLEELNLFCVDYIYMSNCFVNALKRFDQLKIFYCNSCSWFEDWMAEILFEKKTLIILTIYSAKLSSSYDNMKNLVNLKKLDLGRNNNLRDENLLNITSNCRQLLSLRLIKCNRITNCGVASIAQLTKLKTLDIEGLKKVTDEPIGDLPGTLTRFNCDGCTRIKDGGMIRLIERAENLREISLRNCRKITNAFIEAAIDVVEKRTNNITLEIGLKDNCIKLGKIRRVIPPLLKLKNWSDA